MEIKLKDSIRIIRSTKGNIFSEEDPLKNSRARENTYYLNPRLNKSCIKLEGFGKDGTDIIIREYDSFKKIPEVILNKKVINLKRMDICFASDEHYVTGYNNSGFPSGLQPKGFLKQIEIQMDWDS